MRPMKRAHVVLVLGTAQTLAWASSFYLPAMLAAPMARDLRLDTPTLYAVFSMALIVSAFAGPLAGRLIDRHGGRHVLMAANGAFALGLSALGLAQGLPGLIGAWLLIGLAMGCGLYDAAFASLVRLYGRDARPAITGITLVAGFASTVGWPLSALFETHLGWRGACFAWAALHLLVALPLNACLPRSSGAAAATGSAGVDVEADAQVHAQATPPAPARHLAPLLALVFALLSLVSTSIATQLPAVLQAAGATLTVAVATAALVGPAQVAARLLEIGLLQRLSPLVSARAAALGHPAGAAVLLGLGAAGAVPFAVLHGLGNGLLTIVRGTLPLALFGAVGYGARQGWLTLPARVLGALSPWLFGLALARWGVHALWLTAGLGVAAFTCLLALRLPR
jgi:MFS family permease